MTRMNKSVLIILLLILSICSGCSGNNDTRNYEPKKTIRVLLLTGRNNHDWQQTTPALKSIYNDSGRFTVDVITDASTWTPKSLARYDVIVSNWTNFPSKERAWGTEAEATFMNFVRQGKGFVVFHAASACFETWPEFHTLIDATWGKNTGHGIPHSFEVAITDTNHPITSGLRPFSITDELWHRMSIQPSAHVLCKAYSSHEHGGTGQMEPVAFCTEFGKGRCFNLVLGHDVNAMNNLGWTTLMLRGTEWAATGKVMQESVKGKP
jgi:uncharacterized protein